MSTQFESQIIVTRGCRVVLDSDLALLYGVTTKRLNEQVKRNRDRFPEDFMFQLKYQEVITLRSQFATSKGGRRYLPYVFTEHGVLMAANILNSKVAIDASILLVRSFIKMRLIVTEHTELKRKLQEMEIKLMNGFASHERELLEIRFLIAKLEESEGSEKRPIGFFRRD